MHRVELLFNHLNHQQQQQQQQQNVNPTVITPLSVSAAIRIPIHPRQSSTPSKSSPTLQQRIASNEFGLTLADIQSAANRLSGVAHITPVFTSTTLNNLSGNNLYFKCELFQLVGAFKFRGAYNSLARLKAEQPSINTVITHSSGNHAQALALSAKLLNYKAVIVMPSNSSAVKKTAVIQYGATVIECEPNQTARENTATEQLNKYGIAKSILIPPYNYYPVIAGQGTIALELLSQVTELDAIIVPVGGGGMLAGCAIAAKALNPKIKIYAAEPANAPDVYESLKTGRLQLLSSTAPTTIADGLRTSMGSLTWPIICQCVDECILVSETEIIAAMKLVWERMKLLIEPSAAVGVAVALSQRFKQITANNGKPQRIGIILCGGNVDLDSPLPWQQQHQQQQQQHQSINKK